MADGAAGRYLAIADHGLIGDLRSVALVGVNGTIDWYCCPRFDSPSVFASLLDADRGGKFELAPTVPAETKQFYFPDTNVLITRFYAYDGVGEIQDFMPIVGDPTEAGRHRLIRRVLCVRGKLPFAALVAPRFDYGRAHHEVRCDGDRTVFGCHMLTLALTSSVEVTVDGGDARAEFTLAEGETAVFALDRVSDELRPGPARWPRRRSSSPRPCATGGAGWPARATGAGGGRWCTARR
ncbi:trehalase-like domain-containing protein [Catellatospora bangladeshensis]|uniref:trehalase-like domain-containing protein n=1 Tax=Catellatospora bangladeshensis TaxID=310355 RepID=UPI00361FE720